MRLPYTCIYREIWEDDKFLGMSEIGQLVYFYTLTTPLGNGLGCFKAGREALREDSRMPAKRFFKGFDEGLNVGLFEHDAHHRVLLIPTYFDRNPPSNPNGIKSMAKEYIKIPDCELKFKCYHIVRNFVERSKESFKEPFLELFREPLPKQPGTISLSPSLSPSLSDPIPPKPPRGGMDGFEEFYTAYPNKKGKAAAQRAWRKTSKDRPPLDVVISAIEKQKKTHNWKKDGGQFIPHPANWLSDGRWADEVKADPEEERIKQLALELERKREAARLVRERRGHCNQ